MSFATLHHRVRRAEKALELRGQRTYTQWQGLASTWRTTWTPMRIVVAGMGLGFLTGQTQPASTLNAVSRHLHLGQRAVAAFESLAAILALLPATPDVPQTSTDEIT